MKPSIENFIGIYEDAFDKNWCEGVMHFMDKAYELGYGYNRIEANDADKHNKDDMQLYACSILKAVSVLDAPYLDKFNEVLWHDCYKHYADEFSVIKNLPFHSAYGVKLQRTPVGGGYHVWHSERGDADASGRVMAFIAYLNDVDEGGETEFLYQHKRVKPKQGTLVLFPAGFTHTHRGNPPLSNTKYIVTGWIEF
jgi:hypothetical protein